MPSQAIAAKYDLFYTTPNTELLGSIHDPTSKPNS